MVNGIGGKGIGDIQRRFLNKFTKDQNKLFAQISSGQRKLNGSELAVVADLQASVQTLGQASRNIGDAVSALETADGAISQIGEIGTRLEELAIQSANGVLSDDQRVALATEFNALRDEIGRISNTTDFNGRALIGEDLDIQVGEDGSADSRLSAGVADLSGTIASLDGLDISTQAGAQAALSPVSNFRDSLSQARGELGANQVRLETAREGVDSLIVTNTEAASTIRDLDIAQAKAQSVRNSILIQGGVALDAQAKGLSAQNVLKLLA